MTTDTTMTPREICAGKMSLPFIERRRIAGMPSVCKVRKGLMAAVSATGYVEPGMVYGVEMDGNQPQIYSYWRTAENAIQEELRRRPYTLSTVCRLVVANQITKAEPVTYEEMERRIRTLYPTCWVPDPLLFYREYGLVYDEATGEIHNPLGLV